MNTVDVPTLFTELNQEKSEALIDVYASFAEIDFFYKELVLLTAKKNFSRALLLLPKIKNEALQQEILTGLALLEVRETPDLAVRVFDKVPVVEMKKLKEFSYEWSEKAPDQLLQWLFSWDMRTFFGTEKFVDVAVSEQSEFIYKAIVGEEQGVSFLSAVEQVTYEAKAKVVADSLIKSVENAAKMWAKKDYLASQVFLLSLKKGKLKNAFLAGLIEASAPKDALSLFTLLDSTSSKKVYLNFYIRCCIKLAYLNGQEARRRLIKQNVTDPKVYLDLVDAWSFNYPLKALHFAKQTFEPLYQAKAYSLVYKNFFKRWPKRAFENFVKIKDQTHRQRALKAMFAVNVHFQRKWQKEHWAALSPADKSYLEEFKLNKNNNSDESSSEE